MIAWLYRIIVGGCFKHDYKPFGNITDRLNENLDREYFQVHRCKKCGDFKMMIVEGK